MITDAVILAGGYGSRLSEYTKLIPKPMVKIGRKPIIDHIIDIYTKYGVKNFYIATGYKHENISAYFKKNIKNYNSINIYCKFTGNNTATGGRLKKISKFIKSKKFFLTYGDGVSDINIKKLTSFHYKYKALITLSAVHPPARFGELKIKKNVVTQFNEKPQLVNSWINGGFFVIDKKFIKFIKNYNEMLEREPVLRAVKNNQINAFKHRGFWQCMDTKRDKDYLDNLILSKKAPWLI